MNDKTFLFDTLPLFDEVRDDFFGFQDHKKREFLRNGVEHTLAVYPAHITCPERGSHNLFPGPDEKQIVKFLRRLGLSFGREVLPAKIEFSAENFRASAGIKIQPEDDHFYVAKSLAVLSGSAYKLSSKGGTINFRIIGGYETRREAGGEVFTVGVPAALFAESDTGLL